jgi:hypothetical protein
VILQLRISKWVGGLSVVQRHAKPLCGLLVRHTARMRRRRRRRRPTIEILDCQAVERRQLPKQHLRGVASLIVVVQQTNVFLARVRECVSACVSERVTCLRRSSSSRAFTIASASALSLETNQSQFERKQRNKRSALGRELVELADQCLSVTRRRHRTIHRHSACTCIDIDIDVCSSSRVDRSVCVNGSRQQRQLCHVGIVIGNASQEHIVIGIVG